MFVNISTGDVYCTDIDRKMDSRTHGSSAGETGKRFQLMNLIHFHFSSHNNHTGKEQRGRTSREQTNH